MNLLLLLADKQPQVVIGLAVLFFALAIIFAFLAAPNRFFNAYKAWFLPLAVLFIAAGLLVEAVT